MTTTGARTAAHLLVDCLAAEGCEYVFSVPGEETMDVLDALSDQPTVRHVTTRHEQGAAFMADVYGRLTGRAAVAMATLGPGATNLVTGIADAYLDRAPMVAITGQAGSDKLHKEAHQVVDIVRHARAGHEVEHSGPAGRARSPRSSARRSGSRRSRSPDRPTSSCPRTSRRWRSSRRCRATDRAAQAYFPEPTDEAIAHAADLIAASERPLVLAGNGVLRRGRRAELRAFAAGLHVPVAVTFMGKGAIDDRSHLSLMAVGLQARDHVLTGFDRADLVICVGYDLVEYAPARWNPDGRKRIVHIDTQPAEVDAEYRPEVELIGDIDGSLRRLLGGGPAPRDQRPRRRRAARGPRDARPRRPPDRAPRRPRRRAPPTTAGRSSPQRAIADLRRALGPTTSWSATSAPTRSGSRGCTRRTSRTP